MTGIELPFRVDAQVTGAGAARQRPVGSAMDFLQRDFEIAERIRATGLDLCDGLFAARDHMRKMAFEIGSRERQGRIWRNQQRRKADIIESELDHVIEQRQQRAAPDRHRRTRCKLLRPPHPFDNPQRLQDRLVAVAAVVHRPLRVMHIARAVQADRDREGKLIEQPGILFAQ
jgi:hypothetical protein